MNEDAHKDRSLEEARDNGSAGELGNSSAAVSDVLCVYVNVDYRFL